MYYNGSEQMQFFSLMTPMSFICTFDILVLMASVITSIQSMLFSILYMYYQSSNIFIINGLAVCKREKVEQLLLKQERDWLILFAFRQRCTSKVYTNRLTAIHLEYEADEIINNNNASQTVYSVRFSVANLKLFNSCG